MTTIYWSDIKLQSTSGKQSAG